MRRKAAQSEGESVQARPAAAIVLVRDQPGEPEILLVQRNPKARFMGGVWVFPGGSLQSTDYEAASASPSASAPPLSAARLAARRELGEEAGIDLPADCALVPFARWITPVGLPIRFDTLFFLARLGAHASPRVDGAECVAARFLSPRAALAEAAAGRLALAFPTVKQLEALGAFASVEELFAAAPTFDLEPICPQIVPTAQGPALLMPGREGYSAP